MIYALLGAIFNRVRGSSIPYGGTINALAFGVAVYFATGSYWGLPLMLLGQSLGWGRYIGAVFNKETKTLEEVWFIDQLILWARFNQRLWGFLGLTLRGAVWGLCLAPVSLWSIAGGATMGLCYLIAGFTPIRHKWELGEVVYGAVLWYSIQY